MTATPRTTTPKVVLITGASSGIGYHTALHLAAQGHSLVVGARRTDRLDALVAEIRAANGTADAHELDVTDLGSMQAFAGEAERRYGRIDAVVANAGVMPLSRLDALKVDEWNRMVDVNVRGVLHAIAAVLPVFQRQDAGHFLTVASVGAHAVSPTAAVYCATKYAAWALTEGLRQEVGDRIRVTTISPGVVESELADTITDPATAELMRTYRAVSLPPEAIARAIGYAIEQPVGVDVNEMILRPTAQV